LNIEGLHYLFKTAKPAADTWSRRAFKHLQQNIAALQRRETYSNIDRYRRAVADINRVLEIAGKHYNIQLSLANYQDNEFSPLKSVDLLQVAENYSTNIFYPYFKARLEEILDDDNSSHIGLSLNYLSQANCCFAIIGYLKRNYPQKKIIVGGGLVTTWLSNPAWRNPFGRFIDHLISGRGEGPLLRILRRTPKVQQVRPCYDTLRTNSYLAPGFILPYAASFGCFWKKCSFCPEKSEKNPYDHVPPETTVNDLAALTEVNSPALIHFLDNALSPATLRAASLR
ncbi:MAG: radical SAM protein, partial [Desulforhopalus sp.]